MRLAAIAALLAFLAPFQGRAEIAVLYWPGTKTNAETRRQLELMVKDVAAQFATQNDNTDLGALDLLHGTENVKVHIWTEDADDPVYYLWGEIFCHVSVTKDLAGFRQKLMHEFSHLYDYTMMEIKKKERAKQHPLEDFRIRKGHAKDPLIDYVRDNDRNEARAKLRETRYMAGPGQLIPAPCMQHDKPNACVQSFDFRKAQSPFGGDRRLDSILDSVSRYGGTVIHGSPYKVH
ncbi:MAG: hypothetical protein HY303_19930 [Candidatus Wallbacteria bacterium]|nr:hypothetical protein [Candidatus Wallbacteria bacterium]